MNEEQITEGLIKQFVRQSGGTQLYAIQQIKKTDPSERDRSNRDQTLKIFLDAGLNRQEHSHWRDNEMLNGMEAIAIQEWARLNSVNLEEKDHMETNGGWPGEPRSWQDTSLTLHEIEVLAAEKWIQDCHKKHNGEPENRSHSPEHFLTYEQLQENIQHEDIGAEHETIRQSAYRAVQQAVIYSKPLPIQLGGVARKYQLVKLGDIKNNEKQPGVKKCCYQKIKPNESGKP